MEQESLTVIFAEVSSAQSLAFLNNEGHVYGDWDVYEFHFKTYSPVRLKQYPDRHFLYVAYSESELRKMYEKVDMTYRIEPVDYLLYALRGTSYCTFSASNTEILAKLGEMEFYPFPQKNPDGAGTENKKDYSYIIQNLLGEMDTTTPKKNSILVFATQNDMLKVLHLLLHGQNDLVERVRVGKLHGSWALAITHSTNEAERVRSAELLNVEFDELTYTDHISAESHGFTEHNNIYAEEHLKHHRRPEAA